MKCKAEIIFYVIILVFSQSANAQKKIQLTNIYSNKVIELKEGTRVRYSVKDRLLLRDQNEMGTGILGHVTDSTIQVNSEVISLQNISAIGQRKQGTGFCVFILSAIAGTIAGNLLFPPNPCPQCQQIDETPKSVYIIWGVGSVVFLTLAINTEIKNSMKDITVDWRLKIIN